MAFGFDLVEELLPFGLDLSARAGRLALRVQNVSNLLQPIGGVFSKVARAVRDLSKRLGKTLAA